MFKRVILFLLTNLMIIATVSIVTSLLGIRGYLTEYGIDFAALAIFCGLWGTAGAFISLLMSKFMAKMAMGVEIIDPDKAHPADRQLLDTVHRLARHAGLKKMPEVGIYNSPEVNAFATGPSKTNSLVAVSTGLLETMKTDEVDGVLAHEISHVVNGDMVTMTLIQGIVNAFAMFLSRIVAYAISTAISRGNESGEGISYFVFYLLTFVFDILFTLLGSVVTAAFSRWREFRADAGGARLAGVNNMIAGLKRLQSHVEGEDNRAPSMATLKISHKRSIIDLFSTHPPLTERIRRLQAGEY